MKPNFAGLNDFARGYITAALWTFDDDAPPGEYSTSGRPEELYAKLAPETVETMLADCLRFQNEQAGQLRIAEIRDFDAGSDFWLTRNRHGSGFWDRDNIPDNQAEELTKAAHAFGERNLYFGDDGQIYIN